MWKPYEHSWAIQETFQFFSSLPYFGHLACRSLKVSIGELPRRTCEMWLVNPSHNATVAHRSGQQIAPHAPGSGGGLRPLFAKLLLPLRPVAMPERDAGLKPIRRRT